MHLKSVFRLLYFEFNESLFQKRSVSSFGIKYVNWELQNNKIKTKIKQKTPIELIY